MYKQYWPMGLSTGLEMSSSTDMVLFSECEHIVYFTELTIPFEDAVEKAFDRK